METHVDRYMKCNFSSVSFACDFAIFAVNVINMVLPSSFVEM